MVYRKGELSPAGVDSGWPHQVAAPASLWFNNGYKIIDEFCRELSVCPRGHSVIGPDGQWWNVKCFKTSEDADKFRERFGGEKFDPRKRGKGRAWS
jgi:hypothetical protein